MTHSKHIKTCALYLWLQSLIKIAELFLSETDTFGDAFVGTVCVFCLANVRTLRLGEVRGKEKKKLMAAGQSLLKCVSKQKKDAFRQLPLLSIVCLYWLTNICISNERKRSLLC